VACGVAVTVVVVSSEEALDVLVLELEVVAVGELVELV
jgi:hypothetical protein